MMALLICMTGCGSEPEYVEVFDGNSTVEIEAEENVEQSKLNMDEFYWNDSNTPVYTGDDFTTTYGVDVSAYQGTIDWNQVAASGYTFAMIRCGYRGCEQGALFKDDNVDANIQGAKAAGLNVGVYFFSQAISVDEAKEEAEFVLDMIKDYDIDLQIAFDWERVENVENVRTADMTDDDVTNVAVEFCKNIQLAGYIPSVYMSINQGYYVYDLDKIRYYSFWISDPTTYPDFYYSHTLWQYNIEATIPGISVAADLDMMFIPKETD